MADKIANSAHPTRRTGHQQLRSPFRQCWYRHRYRIHSSRRARSSTSSSAGFATRRRTGARQPRLSLGLSCQPAHSAEIDPAHGPASHAGSAGAQEFGEWEWAHTA
jgi:hypothetical protein